MGLAETVRRKWSRFRRLPDDITIQLERDSTEDLRASSAICSISRLQPAFCICDSAAFHPPVPGSVCDSGQHLFSLMMSLSILFFMNYTLNVLTLAGLTVALGMIIDNAVVVLSSSTRSCRRPRQGDRTRAQGTSLHAGAGFGSTLTTVGSLSRSFLRWKSCSFSWFRWPWRSPHAGLIRADCPELDSLFTDLAGSVTIKKEERNAEEKLSRLMNRCCCGCSTGAPAALGTLYRADRPLRHSALCHR
jgi:hypothetical protein